MEGIVQLLLLSGLCSLSCGLYQHHFTFFHTPKSWNAAQSYCRQIHCDLATIDDMAEMRMVLNLTDHLYDDAAWIGLHKGTSDVWHWSLPDKSFYKEGERTNATINGNQYSCCAVKDGRIVRRSCTSGRKFVCFDAEKQGQEQYVVVSLSEKWLPSQSYCRKYHYDLASVRNPSELLAISEVAAGMVPFIGCFRDPWVWSGGTYSSLRYWEPAQTVATNFRTSCVAMLKSQSGRWGERPCEDAYPFLCHCPNKRNRIQVKISSKDPGLDLNDPALQEGILMHMKRTLNQSFANPDFHLRWKKHPDGNVFVKEE